MKAIVARLHTANESLANDELPQSRVESWNKYLYDTDGHLHMCVSRNGQWSHGQNISGTEIVKIF